MSLPEITSLIAVAAAAPLVIVLYLMIVRNWGGSEAGPVGWLSAVIVAMLLFGANVQLLLVALGRALMLALFVLYIIWMALLLYQVVSRAGAIRVIGHWLPTLAQDRSAQALLLGWVFGSFLQGASGFGVPAAVVAPLLVGLGFKPNVAVVIALLGHAWAVTFGSLGSSFFSLIAATGEPGENLAGPAALMLGLTCLLCGLGVLWISGGWQAFRRRWLQLAVVGIVMATIQYGLARVGLWSLAAFGAGMAGLIVIAIDLHTKFTDKFMENIQFNEETQKSHLTEANPQVGEKIVEKVVRKQLITSIVPYLILTIVIVVGQLLLQEPLSVVTIEPAFPAVSTSFGWETPSGPGRSLSLFGHAGALLLYASALSYFWFRWRKPLSKDVMFGGRMILQKTISGSIKSTIGISTLVAMAVTMQHVGMTQVLAELISAGTGSLFPMLSPIIGALGAFMTGSNTNSNVVFGLLQLTTASALGLSIPLILASQTTGGAIGSLFAPAKVIVGCSTVEGAEDGSVLKSATFYGVGIILVVGLATWLTHFFLGSSS